MSCLESGEEPSHHFPVIARNCQGDVISRETDVSFICTANIYKIPQPDKPSIRFLPVSTRPSAHSCRLKSFGNHPPSPYDAAELQCRDGKSDTIDNPDSKPLGGCRVVFPLGSVHNLAFVECCCFGDVWRLSGLAIILITPQNYHHILPYTCIKKLTIANSIPCHFSSTIGNYPYDRQF